MSSPARNFGITSLAILSLLGLVLFSPNRLLAQDEETPKYDLFVGYQWLHPGGEAPTPGSQASPTSFAIPDMPKGFGTSLTYNFNQNFGFEGDFGHNWDNYETTLSVGPKFSFHLDNATLFIHGMLSYNRLGINGLDTSNGIGGIAGGGMDLRATKLISWRVFEADWVGAQHHYQQFAPSDIARPGLKGVRLRTGLVFSFGYPETAMVAANVSVQPAEAMVGEPLTATATPSNFNPKHELTYAWTSTCGKITGNGATASIDTNGAAGGNCTVEAHVTDPRAKKNNQASATASFTLKEPPKNPPTVSCTANPTSVQAGASVTISCTCTSPDNVPVTVGSYSATGGSISGNGNSATLNTTGASPRTITVNTTCSDQRGLNTPATTEVTVEAPPPPPPPPPPSPEVQRLEKRLSLHSVYFATAQPTPANPKGGLVRSQQATLTDLASDFKQYLQSKPDAKLILAGHTDPRGTAEYNQKLSERRVESAKSFLAAHGVPETNIETQALGKEQQLTAEQVKDSVEQDTELTPGERQRILGHLRTIMLASNRRVDVTLSTTGQTSVKQFPFNAEDSLSLIGGREKPATAKPATTKKKRTTKKKQ
jgi:outer membrane protein OmpA-like peptidoglycan-associated protein